MSRVSKLARTRRSLIAALLSAAAFSGVVALAEPARTAPRTSKADAALAEVTFSGFTARPDGGALLFVELTRSVTVEVTRRGQVIEYRLVGARVPLKNNRHPLLTRDFGSAMVSAVMKPDKGAVRLLVTVRGEVSPSHRMVPRGNAAVLEIELPAR